MISLDCSKLEIIKADKDILRSIEFDCGDDDLNGFLLEDSFANIENSLSKIEVNEKLEINYPMYPAIKIGRLAVHKDYQGKRIGSTLIDWIVGFCLELRKDIGVRFISVDAYKKVKKFYTDNLFEELQNEKNNGRNIPMYKDLCQK